METPIPGDVAQTSRQATTYTYTSLGNLDSVTSPGNPDDQVVEYHYPTPESLGQPDTVTNAENETTSFTYNTYGWTASVTDALTNTTTFDYNLAGQPTATHAPATGNTGSGSSKTTTAYAYLGGPAIQFKAYDEDDQLVRTVNHVLGAEGELLQVTGDTEPSTMVYDAAYNLKSVTDGAGSGHTTSYSYDLNGQCTQVDYPGATGANYNRIKLTYNLIGQVINREDGNDVETAYIYDEPDGGLTTIDYPSGTDTEMEYDDYGRVVLVTDSSGSSSSTYDDLDNLLTSTRTYTGLSGKTFTYTYHPDGLRKTMENPSGTWTYNYDDAGRYTSMSSPLGTVSSTYDDAGRQLTRTLPNGAYTTVTYNEVGTPTSWINKNSGGTKLSEWGSFACDGVFNLTETTASNHIASSQFDGYLNFDYTAKDQLAEEDSSRFYGYTETNVWDGAGNPTTFRDNSGRTYNGNNQRSNSGYSYDGNGNPTTYASTTCTYDVENRLTAFGSEGYAYRADGLRASTGTETSKVYYLYDGGNAVCQLDYQGNLLRTYVYAPDGMVGRTSSSQTRYYLFDWQGNVEHSMSSSTQLNVSYAFNAWGQRNQKFPVNADVGANDQFGYNARWGYMREPTSGFYYCQNRYYDPANGRWLTRDPIGFAGGMNVYGYCGSGPVGSVDFLGLGPQKKAKVLVVLGERSGGLNIWPFQSLITNGPVDALAAMYKRAFVRTIGGNSSVERVVKEATDASSMYFYGHGFGGLPTLNPDEAFDQDVVDAIRKARGGRKMDVLWLDGCETLTRNSPDYWQIARLVIGYDKSHNLVDLSIKRGVKIAW